MDLRRHLYRQLLRARRHLQKPRQTLLRAIISLPLCWKRWLGRTLQRVASCSTTLAQVTEVVRLAEKPFSQKPVHDILQSRNSESVERYLVSASGLNVTFIASNRWKSLVCVTDWTLTGHALTKQGESDHPRSLTSISTQENPKSGYFWLRAMLIQGRRSGGAQYIHIIREIHGVLASRPPMQQQRHHYLICDVSETVEIE